jgi:Ino eighty subunit 2
MPGIGRKIKQKPKENDAEVAEEGDEEESMVVVEEEVKPVMYRWTSSKKVDGESTSMVLSFSVPPSEVIPAPEPEAPKIPDTCAMDGCRQPRKYRLVRDWTIGACGMPHLKALEG